MAILDAANVEALRTVFWDMTKLASSSREVEHPASGDTPAWTEQILTVTITARTPDDMRVFYSFTEEQNAALDELLANSDMLAALAGDLTISDATAKKLLADLPADLDPERRAVAETACRLVGKVNYFWGGKSLVMLLSTQPSLEILALDSRESFQRNKEYELKSIPKGEFVVMKTGTHPMRTKLRLFLDWGITFDPDGYRMPERAARKIAYIDQGELVRSIHRSCTKNPYNMEGSR